MRQRGDGGEIDNPKPSGSRVIGDDRPIQTNYSFGGVGIIRHGLDKGEIDIETGIRYLVNHPPLDWTNGSASKKVVVDGSEILVNMILMVIFLHREEVF